MRSPFKRFHSFTCLPRRANKRRAGSSPVREKKQPMTHLGRPINLARGNCLPVGSFQVVVGLFQLPDPQRRFVALRPEFLDLNLQLRDAAVVLPVQALKFVLQQQSSPLCTCSRVPAPLVASFPKID